MQPLEAAGTRRTVSHGRITGFCAAAVALLNLAGCPAPPPQAVAPTPLQLDPLLESIVQLKVKVGEEMKDGSLQESFEYGTGFFINDRGTILTSAHVIAMVDDPRQITVLHNGRALQARIGKKSATSDLATLIVDAGTTPALPRAQRAPRLGEAVFVIGFPYVDVFDDSKPVVSSGSLAGVDRAITFAGNRVDNLLMTDAFVADGCSGGPLVGEDGTVLGVVRFNLARRGSWLGLSFAEPITSFDSL